jgi:FkbM family methyltransferase
MAESLKARLRRLANRLLHPCGLHLMRHDAAFEMDELLARAAARHPAIATWVDVGASDGIWSLRAHRHFPHARYLLFEPLAERQHDLADLEKRIGFIPVPAAAGAAPGNIEFTVDPELDGSGVASSHSQLPTRTVPVETVSRVVAEKRLKGPFGLKLDTHGHEIAVLEGAEAILGGVELIIVEAYNFKLMPSCLRFHELCAWLESRGFRCCDLADPMRRPADGVLWQMDLAFARASHPMFTQSDYR